MSASSSVIWPRRPCAAMNSRYSSRLCPVSSSTSRAAPDTRARHGVAGQHLAVDDRGERGVGDPDRAPLEVLLHPRGDVHLRRDQAHRVGPGERLVVGGQAGHGGDRLGDRRREVGREERARHGLGDGPAEQAPGVVHREQRGDHAGPGRLAEHGDVGRVAAEALDVVPDPAQRRDRVEQAAVGRERRRSARSPPRQAGSCSETKTAPPRRERRAVVAGAARAEQVRAAVDPDHDRQRPGAWMSGVQTLTVSHSPVVSGGGSGAAGVPGNIACGHCGPNAAASRTPSHGPAAPAPGTAAPQRAAARTVCRGRRHCPVLDAPPHPAGAGGNLRFG